MFLIVIFYSHLIITLLLNPNSYFIINFNLTTIVLNFTTIITIHYYNNYLTITTVPIQMVLNR